MRLDKASKNVLYKVKNIHGTYDQKNKLIGIGFFEDSNLEILYFSPTNYQIAIKVSGNIITLNKEYAQLIEVEIV